MKIKRLILTVFTAFVSLTMGGMLCAGEYAEKPEFKKGDVILGHCNALTGPISAEMELITAGDCARIWYQNHFLNGIQGHRVYRMWEDNEYSAEKSVEMFHRFVASGAIGVLSDGAPSATPLKPLVAREKLPLFEGGFEIKVGYPPGYEWLVGADYGKQAFSVIYWWYKHRWPQHPDYGKRKPRVAFLYWKGGFGESVLPQTVPSLEKLGFEVVKKTVVGYKPVSVMPEIRAMKRSKPDFVYINITVEVTAMLLKEAYAQEMQQSGVQFGGSIWNSNPAITKIAPRGSEGFLVPTPYPWEGIATEGLDRIGALYNEKKDSEYGTAWTKTSNFLTGWLRTSLFISAADRAMKKEGYDKLTGQAVQNELETLVFDVPMCKILIGPKKGQPYVLDYKRPLMPENLPNRFGNDNVFVGQWKGGKWAVIDYLTVPTDHLVPMPKSWMR